MKRKCLKQWSEHKGLFVLAWGWCGQNKGHAGKCGPTRKTNIKKNK